MIMRTLFAALAVLLAAPTAVAAKVKVRLPAGMVGQFFGGCDENPKAHTVRPLIAGEFWKDKSQSPCNNSIWVSPDGSFSGTLAGEWMVCQSIAVRTIIRFTPRTKYYTQPANYHYSGFSNLLYIFDYRCKDGQHLTFDMELTKGALGIGQIFLNEEKATQDHTGPRR
jgi:hypothetical protein